MLVGQGFLGAFLFGSICDDRTWIALVPSWTKRKKPGWCKVTAA
jgi:hypothetical protein